MTPEGPRGLVPSLLSSDIDRTAGFYAGTLGFRVTARWPTEGDPTWIELSGYGVALQFFTEPPLGQPDRPVMSGTLYVPISDIDTLAAHLQGRVAFEWGPETMEYGMRELAVRDPDGYLLAFTEPA